jgi:hypothetical protein
MSYNVVYISSWVGRLGNNVMQILHGLCFAQAKNYDGVVFPDHPHFTSNSILFKKQINPNTNWNYMIQDNFFYTTIFQNHGLSIPSIETQRNHAQTYIIPNLKFKIPSSFLRDQFEHENTLCIHIRSGDLFEGQGTHEKYIQPPLWYYKQILHSRHWAQVFLFAEDDKNPVLNQLLLYGQQILLQIRWKPQSLMEDIGCLLHAKNLVGSYGSFTPMIYMGSIQLKNYYMADWFPLWKAYESYKDVTTHMYPCSNYLSFMGPWKNTYLQHQKILSYVPY